MATRAESTAKTRRALMDAARELLNQGGAAAVTLREVGSRAEVSASAAYRHFTDKQALLDAIGGETWEQLAADVTTAAHNSTLPPQESLRRVISCLLKLARTQPHLYRIMQASTLAHLGAASRAQDALLHAVARTAPAGDIRKLAGLVLSATHGIADLEVSGYLSGEKWGTDGDGLIDTLVAVLGSK